MMDDKNKKSLLISSILNLFAGVLFVLAAFHVITNEAGIDYTSILIGIVFLILGLMGIINRK
jgi:hypothetical protein